MASSLAGSPPALPAQSCVRPGQSPANDACGCLHLGEEGLDLSGCGSVVHLDRGRLRSSAPGGLGSPWLVGLAPDWSASGRPPTAGIGCHPTQKPSLRSAGFPGIRATPCMMQCDTGLVGLCGSWFCARWFLHLSAGLGAGARHWVAVVHLASLPFGRLGWLRCSFGLSATWAALLGGGAPSVLRGPVPRPCVPGVRRPGRAPRLPPGALPPRAPPPPRRPAPPPQREPGRVYRGRPRPPGLVRSGTVVAGTQTFL